MNNFTAAVKLRYATIYGAQPGTDRSPYHKFWAFDWDRWFIPGLIISRASSPDCWIIINDFFRSNHLGNNNQPFQGWEATFFPKFFLPDPTLVRDWMPLCWNRRRRSSSSSSASAVMARSIDRRSNTATPKKRTGQSPVAVQRATAAGREESGSPSSEKGVPRGRTKGRKIPVA